MNIGETIKKLRRQKDMTQEQLAEYLNISPQAVSKWEINSTLPDITLIPMLANVFNVTTDELLGVDVFKRQEKINGYLQEYEKFSCNPDFSFQRLEVARKAYNEFPNDFKIMTAYCSALAADPEHGYDAIRFHSQEIMKICQIVLRDCTEDTLRYSAKTLLCQVYVSVGEKDKAIEIANTFPKAFHQTSDWLLENVIFENGSDEQIQQRQDNRICLFNTLFYNVLLTAHRTPDIPERRSWFEKNICLTELFDDSNHSHGNLGNLYINIAKCYMRENNFNMALENIKKAAEHYTAHDKQPENIENEEKSMKAEMKKYLQESIFNPIQEYDEFINIISSSDCSRNNGAATV
jgi:transcriptional regulator with XRE-family HTH domain